MLSLMNSALFRTVKHVADVEPALAQALESGTAWLSLSLAVEAVVVVVQHRAA
tara:strand:- start:1770 stop:1928 length:159 start_codon:yes stop_codon:yes gene_type:complete